MAEQDDKPAGARSGSELPAEALDAVSGGVKQFPPTTIPMSNGDSAGTLSGMAGGTVMGGHVPGGGVVKTEGSGGGVPPLK